MTGDAKTVGHVSNVPGTQRHVENVPDNDLHCQLPEGSRIKLIGLGGIGCIVLPYLAIFLKSLDRAVRLVLIDGDKFEPGNASRMAFTEAGNKAEIKAAETLAMLGPSGVAVLAVPQYVTQENMPQLIRPGDYVLLCVDNHPTRRLVSDHCRTLSDVVLISGGNDAVSPPDQRGTYGNVQVYVRQAGKDCTASLTRFHPEIAKAEGSMPGEADCAQQALSAPQILFTNLAVASAMLNALFAYTCGRLAYQEVQFDILDARSVPQMPLKPEEIRLLA
jgi:molybdopterin/thiamine biosynthesis adenylyltransferase